MGGWAPHRLVGQHARVGIRVQPSQPQQTGLGRQPRDGACTPPPMPMSRARHHPRSMSNALAQAIFYGWQTRAYLDSQIQLVLPWLSFGFGVIQIPGGGGGPGPVNLATDPIRRSRVWWRRIAPGCRLGRHAASSGGGWALHRGQRPLSGRGGSTWWRGCVAHDCGLGKHNAKTVLLSAFGSAHASTALNAAVMAVVGPVALCVDAAVDVLCRL